MDNTDGGPAFPADIRRFNPATEQWDEMPPQGMTLLDWFAGQALAGLVSQERAMAAALATARDHGVPCDSVVATLAYDQAAAMLAEKRRREEGGK